MALAGRNDPCPCRSGRKYKRCCGYDRASERALEDKASAISRIAALAFDSPRLLPDSDAFDAWVGRVLAGECVADVAEALSTLDEGEDTRIVTACIEMYAGEWPELVRRSGSQTDAVAALLAGAVAAGIRDNRPPARQSVQLAATSEGESPDPIEALGICLNGEQLWTGEDGLAAARAIDAIPDWVDDEIYEQRWHAALGTVVAQRATDWHYRRLSRLVGRIAQRLPFEELPGASAAIALGCVAYTAGEGARVRLAALLLSDMLTWPTQAIDLSRFAA